MKLFQSIRFRISFLVSISFAIVYIMVLIYSGTELKKQARNGAISKIQSISNQQSTIIKQYLENFMSGNRILGQLFEDYKNIDAKKRRPTLQNMLIKVLKENKQMLAAWTIWEPNALDSLDYLNINKPGCTKIGSFSSTYYKNNNTIKLENSSTEGELFIGGYYTIPKNTLKETIMDSYYYSYTGNKQDEILQTGTIVPIIANNKFKGVVGFDISLENFQPLIDKIKFFETGYATLITNSGNIVAHPKKEMIGVNLFKNNNLNIDNNSILDKINQGIAFNYYNDNNENGSTDFIQITPFFIGNSTTPWALVSIVPVDEINMETNTIISITALIGVAGLLIIIIVVWIVIGQITKPLSQISELIKNLNNADLKQLKTISLKFKNEVGKIAGSTHILINWLNKTGKFANEIKGKKYNTEYELLNKNDVLGESLLGMRDHLAKVEEENKIREVKTKQQIWFSEGLSKIGEILRQNGNSVNDMATAAIKFIVDYIDANQGGIFSINDEDDSDIFYELSAAVAYNREKLVNKTVRVGEGLVGRCIFEKLPILLTEIPQDYIKITSGLGTSNPNNILIVPIILNDVIYGVIELASFNKFEKYQIEFIEKINEGIASAIYNLKTTQNIALLLEQSCSQSEMLASQEEEMRQNMEEMQATQEEQERLQEEAIIREKNLRTIIDCIPDSMLTIDRDGNIKNFNPAFCKLSQYKKDDLEKETINTMFNSISLNDILKRTTKTTQILRKDKTQQKVSIKTNIIGNDNNLFLLLIKTV